MEFIGYDNPGFYTSLFILAGLVGLALVIGSQIYEERVRGAKSTRALSEEAVLATAVIGVAIMIASAFTWLLGSSGTDLAAREDHREAISKEISRVYALDLSTEQIASLDYPYGKPTAGIEHFGSTEVITDSSGKYITGKIYLLWDGDKMVLSSSKDGKTFEPLDAVTAKR